MSPEGGSTTLMRWQKGRAASRTPVSLWWFSTISSVCLHIWPLFFGLKQTSSGMIEYCINAGYSSRPLSGSKSTGETVYLNPLQLLLLSREFKLSHPNLPPDHHHVPVEKKHSMSNMSPCHDNKARNTWNKSGCRKSLTHSVPMWRVKMGAKFMGLWTCL